MSELTLKAIEQLLDEKLDQKLGTTESRIIARIDDAQDELARLIAVTVADPFTKRFDEIEHKLDVTDRVQKLEIQINEMRTALHLSN